MAPVGGGQSRSHLRPDRPFQRNGEDLDDGDRETALASAGGHLQAYEPGPDDHHPFGFGQISRRATASSMVRR